MKSRPGGFGRHFWTYSLEKRGKGDIAGSIQSGEKFQEVETAKKSMETHVFCQGLSYAVLTGHGLTESEGMWGRFRGWLRTVRTEYPSVWVTRRVISEDFHRFLPKLKRLKVFGNIIESI
jgi:hypothetical protein